LEQNIASTQEIRSWPGGIATITLFVDDLDASKEFFRNVFGLPVVFEDDDCTVVKFENTLVNLLKAAAGAELLEPAPVASREAGSRFVFTINVKDVDLVASDLVSRGVALLNGPLDRPWGVRTASFIDPGGYIWEIATAIG